MFCLPIRKTRGKCQPYWVNSLVAFVIFSAKRNCGGWAFIPCCVDDFGPTWLPHSRYPWVFWTWTKTCFFSHPLDKALEDTPTKHFKVSSTTGVEIQPFRRGLWNIGKGFRHPSLKLLLPIFSRKGWRKYRQKSFCTSPIDSEAIWQVVFSPVEFVSFRNTYIRGLLAI